VGFRKLSGNVPQRNSDFLHDNVSLHAGDGGNGKVGGAGGVNSIVRLVLNTTGDAVAGPEISVISGKGGDAVGAAAVRAGAGGVARDIQIFDLAQQDQVDPNGPPNVVTLLPNATLQVTAGSGGSTVGTSANGAAGGAVSSLQLLGSNLIVDAGTGSSGKIGGVGGSITTLKILQDGNIFARTASIHAGSGGDSALGSGTRGGNVTGLSTDDCRLWRPGGEQPWERLYAGRR